MKKLLAISAILLFCSALANATIIASLVGAPVPTGPNFAFNYQATLSADERLDPAATNGTTCQGPNGLVACNPPGTFFTIYDIGGFQSTSVSAPNWGASIHFTGLTPSTINGNAFDNPNTVNVTFTYTGAVVHGPATFAGFQIISQFSNTAPGTFTSQATKEDSGNTDQTSGPLTIPANVPEPATIGLIGLGLLGLAAIRRRKA